MASLPNDERFITVYRTRDPVELGAIEDYLRAHGIAARGIGTRNASLIGAAQHIFKLRIEVPTSQELVAREAIAAFTSGTTGVALEDLPDELRAEPGDELATDPTEPPRDRPKSVVKAIAATFIVPGGAHWYAGRPWAAGVIALGEVGAVVTLVTTSWVRFVAGVVLLGGMLLFDLIVGARAVSAAARPTSRGAAPSRGRQLAVALAALAVVIAAAVVIAPRVPEPRSGPGEEDLLLDPELWRATSPPADPGLLKMEIQIDPRWLTE